MNALIGYALAALRQRWRDARADDTGATAIEWAIFALMTLAVAGAVAAAITVAVQNRSAKIQ